MEAQRKSDGVIEIDRQQDEGIERKAHSSVVNECRVAC